MEHGTDHVLLFQRFATRFRSILAARICHLRFHNAVHHLGDRARLFQTLGDQLQPVHQESLHTHA